MSKFIKITHNLTNEGETLFTFITEGNKKIGEIVICKTCKGYRLGKIIEITDKCDFTPTASAVKINNGRRRNLLSNFQRAELALLEENITNLPEEEDEKIRKVLNNFLGYGDEREITAFLYKYGCENVHFKTDSMGYKHILWDIEEYDEEGFWEGSYSRSYCFG